MNILSLPKHRAYASIWLSMSACMRKYRKHVDNAKRRRISFSLFAQTNVNFNELKLIKNIA